MVHTRNGMKLQWNEERNKLNICKHGIDFNDISLMFDNPMLVKLDNRNDYGEDRWIGIGSLLGIVVVVVYTEQVNDIIRIISARKATKREVKGYAEAVKN